MMAICSLIFVSCIDQSIKNARILKLISCHCIYNIEVRGYEM